MTTADETRNADVMTETSDTPLWLPGALAAGLAILVAICIMGVVVLYPQARFGASDAPRYATAEPRLQSDPVADMAAYRASEDHELTSYGWIDRSRNIVRLPIEQAIQDVAKSGIGDWPGASK